MHHLAGNNFEKNEEFLRNQYNESRRDRGIFFSRENIKPNKHAKLKWKQLTIRNLKEEEEPWREVLWRWREALEENRVLWALFTWVREPPMAAWLQRETLIRRSNKGFRVRPVVLAPGGNIICYPERESNSRFSPLKRLPICCRIRRTRIPCL